MASWHFGQLKYAAGFGTLMSFYGIIGLIVWIGGTKFGLPINYRIVTIAVILLTLPFALIIGFVAARRGKKKKLEAEKAVETKAADNVSDEKAPKIAQPSGNYNELEKSAEEVVQFLKSSNLGAGGKEAVYSLPWYVVAGVPKSGKSSLVLGSNLNFQNLPSQRQSEQKFIRSTGSVDWRVTSDAVFADTAGRYQTEGADQDEWAGLIETIKKYRPKRPLDGFLLAVSLDKILNASEQQIEQTAKVLRTRLDEAMQRVKIRFPVYLIFTNADVIEGFRDSFSTSKNEGKNLVWGSTIPLEKSENAQTLFDGEYEILQNSLMKRRLMRLSAPFPPVRQLRIFNFPLHFGSSRRKIGAFVATLFRPNPFNESPFLRGFYFTAAPTKNERTSGNAPQTIGNTYFTERLFRDVVLRDKDLVRTFQEQKQKPPILGWLLTALGALGVISLLTLVGVSLYNNKQLLDEAGAKGETLLTIVKSDAGKNPLTKNNDEAAREINATEDLRGVLAKLDAYNRDGAPYYLGMGLYSGNRVYYEDNGNSKSGLLPIYLSVIEQRYKNPTVEKMKEDLRQFAASQPVANPGKLTKQEEENLSRNYDLFKAYLMMTDDYKDKAVASHISGTLKDVWVKESKVPAGQELYARQQLDFWAKQVEQNKNLGSLLYVPLDKPLVESVRKKLQLFPATFRYYKDQVTKISKEVDEKAGPTNVEGILSRSGGDTSYIEGSYTVPGAYTLEGYKLMKTSISEANTKLGEENWVMGEQGAGDIAQTTDAGAIQDLYMRDYTDHWRSFVKGINVKYDKQNAKEALQVFASANSPVKIIVGQIAKNTNFSAKPEAQGWWDWFTGLFSRMFSSRVSTDTGGGTIVEKEFLPLFTFVGTPDKPNAPIDAYQTEIGRVANKYSGFSPTEINQISQDLAKDDDKKFNELRTAKSKIDGILNAVGATPAGQDVASLLRQPLDTLSSLLGADAKSQLAKTWTDQILPLAGKAHSGFPFEDGEADADLTNLTAYLNPVDGKLSKFYDERLGKYFDGNPGSLKLKENSEVKFSDEFITYLNNAFRLREALYGKNASPNFSYQFTLKPVDKAIIEGTIDGQTITSEGAEASKLLKFPADAGSGGIGVFLKLIGGAATDSSANITAPPVNSSSNANSAPPVSSAAPNVSAAPDAELKKTGTWGLFKFFDQASTSKEASGEYTLNFKIGGKTATAIIKPSGGDLFNKDLFKSARPPQTFLKQ